MMEMMVMTVIDITIYIRIKMVVEVGSQMGRYPLS
jgi:hypothetical protein